jgi:hypothetical protein
VLHAVAQGTADFDARMRDAVSMDCDPAHDFVQPERHSVVWPARR